MKALYIDTSAAIKQVREEPETSAYLRFLADHRAAGTALTSSLLLDVELSRFAVREGIDADTHIAPVLGAFARRLISPRVVRDASSISVHVRSLDAIHLATAAALGEDLMAIVTYDHHMLTAARVLGLPTATPGLKP